MARTHTSHPPFAPSSARLGADPGVGPAFLNLLAGIWLFISHWVLGYTGSDPTWNDIIFGIVVGVLALVRMGGRDLGRFASVLNAAAGVWLFIAGLTIASSSAAQANNIILGAVVFALALAAGLARPLESRRS
jgi:SPW repeat